MENTEPRALEPTENLIRINRNAQATFADEEHQVCEHCGFSLSIGGHNPRTGCSGRTAVKGGAR